MIQCNPDFVSPFPSEHLNFKNSISVYNNNLNSTIPQTRPLGHLATLFNSPLPFVQRVLKTTLTANVDQFSHQFKFLFSHLPHQQINLSSCLASWRKFLTPSTTLLPLLATQSILTSPPKPLLVRRQPTLLPTRKLCWPALQREEDFTSVTSHMRPPRGSCKPSSRDT